MWNYPQKIMKINKKNNKLHLFTIVKDFFVTFFHICFKFFLNDKEVKVYLITKLRKLFRRYI